MKFKETFVFLKIIGHLPEEISFHFYFQTELAIN